MSSLFKKQLWSYAITFTVYFFLLHNVGVPNAAIVTLILMGAIGFHEYGHLWAAKKMGFQARGFFLIPFMGGVSLSDGDTKRFSQKVFVVIMGPVWGGALAIATYGLYLLTGVPLIGEAALWMCFINLFNLIPLSFMDGGQLLESVAYSINDTFGMVIMWVSTLVAVPILWFFNPMIAVMVGYFGYKKQYGAYLDWKMRKEFRFNGFGEYHPCPLPQALSTTQLIQTVCYWILTSVILFALLILLRSHGLNMMHMFHP